MINACHIGGNATASMVSDLNCCLVCFYCIKPTKSNLMSKQHIDCGDNTDELGCAITNITDIPIIDEPPNTDRCLKNQFMCNTIRCISKSYVCDGFPDCPGTWNLLININSTL